MTHVWPGARLETSELPNKPAGAAPTSEGQLLREWLQDPTAKQMKSIGQVSLADLVVDMIP